MTMAMTGEVFKAIFQLQAMQKVLGRYIYVILENGVLVKHQESGCSMFTNNLMIFDNKGLSSKLYAKCDKQVTELQCHSRQQSMATK